MNKSNKPKVPRKPSHLVCQHRKTPSSPIPSGKNDNIHVTKPTSKTCKIRDDRKKPLVAQDKRRRRSSSPALTKTEFRKFESTLNKQCNCSSEDIDEDPYVEINYPMVAPGTLIRTDENSGEIEILPGGMNQTQSAGHQKRLPPRSASDTAVQTGVYDVVEQRDALVEELRQCFKNTSLEELHTNVFPTSSVDEGGYEVPIALQTPTYMCLDDLAFTREETDTTTDSSQKNKFNKITRNKKVRLARYRRNLQHNFYPGEGSGNLSPVEVETVDANYSVEKEQADIAPINSFLSSRIQKCASTCQMKQNKSDSHFCTSLGSSSWTYSASETDDEWSDSDCEYYQQIDFPPSQQSPIRRCEHAYEMIIEYRGSTKNGKSNLRHSYEDVDLQLSNRSVMCSAKLPQSDGEQVQEHRKNFSEIRCTHVADCTWATVATPGVLKLADYKNLGRTELSKKLATAQAR